MQDGDMGIRMEVPGTAAEAMAAIVAAYGDSGLGGALFAVRSGMTGEEIEAVGKAEASIVDGDLGLTFDGTAPEVMRKAAAKAEGAKKEPERASGGGSVARGASEDEEDEHSHGRRRR
jgi:hypothetical protein